MAVSFGKQKRDSYQVSTPNNAALIELMARSMNNATKSIGDIGQNLATEKTLGYLDNLNGNDRTADNIMRVTQGANLTPDARKQVDNLIAMKKAEEQSALQNDRMLNRDTIQYGRQKALQDDRQNFSAGQNALSRAMQMALQKRREAQQNKSLTAKQSQYKEQMDAKAQQKQDDQYKAIQLVSKAAAIGRENKRIERELQDEDITSGRRLQLQNALDKNNLKIAQMGVLQNSLMKYTNGSNWLNQLAYPKAHRLK